MHKAAIITGCCLVAPLAYSAETSPTAAPLTFQNAATVCYYLNVLRPLGAPASDGKPRLVPLAGAATPNGGDARTTSASCSAGGSALKVRVTR